MSNVCILNENGKKEKEFAVKGRHSEPSKVPQWIPRPFAVGYETSFRHGCLYGEFSRLADHVVGAAASLAN